MGRREGPYATTQQNRLLLLFIQSQRVSLENSLGDLDPKKNHSLDIIKKRRKHMMSIHQRTEMLKPSGQCVNCEVSWLQVEEIEEVS